MSDSDQSDAQDKSHDASPRKLEKSREQGDVAYSTEVTMASTYAMFYLGLILCAGWATQKIAAILSSFLENAEDASRLILSDTASSLLSVSIINILMAMAPIFALLALGTILSIIGQRGFTFAPSKIKPKMSRLSIISNAKQKFGPNGISEFLKSFAKLSAVLGILLFAFKSRFLELPTLAGLPANSVADLLHREAIFFIGLTTIAAAAIAVVDLPWRIHQHRHRLKMSYEELKKESKESEGDPSMTNARKQRAQDLATNRMMQDVPTADIIIVNPTHYAVALKWERDGKSAPICVAKGIDEIAAKIRETASLAGVPIRRDPPTARSIHGLVEIGQEIEKEHYAAVAAAMHYADQMRDKWKKRGGHAS